MKHKLLMVDDDAILLEFAGEFLEEKGYSVERVGTGSEAIERVKKAPRNFSLIILDYQMNDENGADIAEALVSLNPNIFILIYSGKSSREAIIRSTRNGARGFVDKGEGIEVFLREIQKLCERFEKEALTVADLPSIEESQATISSIGMVGQSTSLAAVASRVKQLQGKKGPVLILGESGTGKELVARALHNNQNGPFKAVNGADYLMSKGTARAELFGYVKGAFTGADEDRAGVFEEAKGGTVFLDEIYSLPPQAQVGLLRALQEKVITRIGSTKEVAIKCRIFAAAKPELGHDVAKAHFKPDLYYRISQNIIEIPPLRDRPDDLPLLVDHFSRKWCEENGEEKAFLASTISFLEQYSWPGNARELENIVYSILNVSPKKLIAPEDLGERFRRADRVAGKPATSLRALIDAVEKKHLEEVASGYPSLRQAARALQVSPQTLLRLLEKHDLKSHEILGTKLRVRKGTKR